MEVHTAQECAAAPKWGRQYERQLTAATDRVVDRVAGRDYWKSGKNEVAAIDFRC